MHCLKGYLGAGKRRVPACRVEELTEADGLAALRLAGMRAPQPVSHAAAASHSYLLLEYLELGGRKDFAALGRMLAQAHRKAGPRFGWHRDLWDAGINRRAVWHTACVVAWRLWRAPSDH